MHRLQHNVLANVNVLATASNLLQILIKFPSVIGTCLLTQIMQRQCCTRLELINTYDNSNISQNWI
jgi:hypothetical protein